MKKRGIIFMIILPIIAFMVIYTYFAYHPEAGYGSSNESSADVTIVEATLPVPTDIADENNIEAYMDANGQIVIASEQLYMLLPVQPVLQLPELPTGCEITSLTTVLNYLGYNVDKTTMAADYLDCVEALDGSFYDSFSGSPFQTNGWGCFAPAITNAANRYLRDQNADYTAHNISTSGLQSIFNEVISGNPVIIWTSSDYSVPVSYRPVSLSDGTVFRWPSNEHCVVLIGFNLERNIVYLSDPLHGVVERNLTAFANYYQSFYRQAVVIK